MTKYLITLTPVGLFFFGGEQTFGDGTNDNYFARSNPFPQQTTLLGMLRKEVLIQSNLFKENRSYTDPEEKETIVQKIGGKSFNISPGNSGKQAFGVIKELSPLFITRQEKQADQKKQARINPITFFIPCPNDYGLTLSKKPGRAHLDRETDFIPFFEDYNAKEGLPSSFISSDSRECIPFDSVFKECIKIGIDKERPTGDDDDDKKFFKHQFYTMYPDFSFAFFAEVEMLLKNATVFMGADSSSFFMDVKEAADGSFEKLFSRKADQNKLTLLSDAFVEPSIYESCEFAITETVDFKNIRTSTGNYAFKQGEIKSKSGKYTFLKRGSVLFVKGETERAKVKNLLTNAHLQMIGYNHFK